MKKLALLFILFVTITACSDSTPIFQQVTNGRAEVVGIEITPNVLDISNSTTSQKFTVFANYQNNTQAEITAQVQWISTVPTIGTVNQQGYFQIRNTGSTVITAAFQGFISNEATVTISGYSILHVDGAYTGITEGSKTEPFNTITDAVNHAKDIGARTIKVAKGNYTESIIIDRDISLIGGYNATYDGTDWAPPQDAEIKASDTVINASGTIAIQYSGGLTSQTILQNFRITGSGDASNSSSIAIFIQQSSPTIENNEIYAGTCTGTSVAILNQTASPLIKDNPIISSGLPVADNAHAGGGADSITILNQSFSSPTIQGTRTGTDSTQVITGPTGGENSFRIKCESSSNPIVIGNKLEILSDQMDSSKKIKGILTIGSSPTIENNVITSTDNNRVAIRGENTSFKVQNGNNITGGIEITSNSLNAVLDGNELIDGNVTVSGSSTGIEIKNHVRTDASSPLYAEHYGVEKFAVITGGINFNNYSYGTVFNSACNGFAIIENSNVQIFNNFIFSGIYINNSDLELINNYIEHIGERPDSGQIRIINAINSYKFNIINNILIGEDTKTTNGWVIGIYLEEVNHFRIFNNILNLKSNGLIQAIYLIDLEWKYGGRVSNNIFNLINATDQYAIYRFEDSFKNNLVALNGNLVISDIISSDFVLYHSFYSIYESLRVSEVNSLNGVMYFNFGTNEMLYTENWHELKASLNYSNYFINYDETNFFNSNYRIHSSSQLLNKGSDPSQVEAIINNDHIAKDFDGCTRSSVADHSFSVGPYEYNIVESSRSECVK